MKKIIFIVIFLSLGFIMSLFYKAYQSRSPEDKSTFDGSTLAKCPDKPNCVSSFNDKSSKNYIEPLKVDKLNFSLENVDTKNFQLVKKEPNYLYLTDTSKIFGFIDDIELLYNEEERLIHFRSASRVGYSDMGKNRKRVEALKSKIMEALNQ